MLKSSTSFMKKKSEVKTIPKYDTKGICLGTSILSMTMTILYSHKLNTCKLLCRESTAGVHFGHGNECNFVIPSIINVVVTFPPALCLISVS